MKKESVRQNGGTPNNGKTETIRRNSALRSKSVFDTGTQRLPDSLFAKLSTRSLQDFGDAALR
jgi:hypothetical protein